jgi:hypothetical protein
LSELRSNPPALIESLAGHWPELFLRLGNRAQDYVDAGTRKVGAYKVVGEASVSRFVNLCCALGPNFEEKPENEWALALLSDDRLDEWVKLHQLVVRSAAVLGRRMGDDRQIAAQFLRADAALLDLHDVQRKAADNDAVRLARVACDLEAVDVRVLEIDWRREYKQVDGTWQLVKITDNVASVRMGPGKPAPGQVSVLTHAPDFGDMARLQVRLLVHSHCDQDRHPLVTFAGAHGLTQWRGHLAQAVSWKVPALPPIAAAPGMGATMLEEAVPGTSLLRTTSCGVRDDGVPTGPLQTYVWAYPADQYLMTIHRESVEEMTWPRQADLSAKTTLSTTRFHLERDGRPLVSAGWIHGFQEALQHDLYVGLDKLFTAWQRTTQSSTMKASVTLLAGKATLTRGWREGEAGLAGAPYMRVAGELDLNHLMNLELAGEVEVGVTRTRIRLRVHGDSPMKHVLAREAVSPSLFEVLLGVTSRWQMKFQVDFDPVAVDDGVLWRNAGPCTGSLTGEVGLRPCPSGGGWQWYARMRSEPVSMPICLHDPVLGQTHRTLFLLPGVDLLEWSLG